MKLEKVLVSKKKILVLAFSPINRDARVLRQITYLSQHYEIMIIGFGELILLPGIEMISLDNNSPESGVVTELIKKRFIRGIYWRYLEIRKFAENLKFDLFNALGRSGMKWFYEQRYWSSMRKVSNIIKTIDCDAIQVNDWDTLPLGIVKGQRDGIPVMVDLHEYGPLQNAERQDWGKTAELVNHLLKKYLPKATIVYTVAPSIAKKYLEEFGVNVNVVYNAPDFRPNISFKPTNPDVIHLIHHGIAARQRELERMIETLSLCDTRYQLHFMLMIGIPDYYDELRALAEKICPGRVTFETPVPPEEIVDKIANYDMGFYILKPVNYNQSNALPNKFFDFINAGLAVCVGPSIEMARITREYHLGIVANSFEPADVAAVVNGLSPAEIDAMKTRALEARKVFCANHEMEKVLGWYQKYVG